MLGSFAKRGEQFLTRVIRNACVLRCTRLRGAWNEGAGQPVWHSLEQK